MKITIENYEAYALDFLEGSLGQREEKAFRKFLDEHPEIKEEMEGLSEIVLIPANIEYPNKDALYRRKGGKIIPFRLVSRVAAAAAVILLATAGLYMLWNTTDHPDGITITDSQPSSTLNETETFNLPATKTPVPEEHPETNVMAHKGNVSGQTDHTDDRSPALTFGSEQPEKTNSIAQEAEHSATDNIQTSPVRTPELLAAETSEIETNPVELPEPFHVTSRSVTEETVALLPSKNNMVISPHSLQVKARSSLSEKSNNTFEIHIPGQFLSETWGDLSLANFKNKLLPEFLNKN